METDDPTEYFFATEYLDGFDHWQRLCKSPWFKPYIDRWRKELQTRLEARALRAMRAEAENPESKNSFAANKYLLDNGWKKEKKNPRGRPSKQEVEQEASRLAEESRTIEHAFERVFGHG
jgi:hypothetical protein